MQYYLLLFVLFVGTRYLANYFFHDIYLAYIITIMVSGFALMIFWREFPELKFKFDWTAILVGIGVCILWIALEGHYPWFSFLGTPGEGFNPHKVANLLFIPAILFRLVGSLLVAPIIEELFFRSFLYRFIATKNWKHMKIGKYNTLAFFTTIIFFGFIHMRWLPGLIAGLGFTSLMIYRRNISSPILAHITANLCLSLYVLSTQLWTFW